MIGDPTGRSKTRPPLSTEDIARNAETYKAQVFKILDRQKTVVDFNSRWLHPLGSEGLIRLAARYNVAQMFERRDFKQRYETGKPIAVHEFLYPLAQAYDSVFLKADVELGGTDQLFNLNVGRDIMPAYGLAPQVVMTTPLLVGLDGVEYMSRVPTGVTENLADVRQPMSISDDLMAALLLLTICPGDIGALKAGRCRRRIAWAADLRGASRRFPFAAGRRQGRERVRWRSNGELPIDDPRSCRPRLMATLSAAKMVLAAAG
jgi:tyrosyl-tRNA synthetase